MVLQVILVRDNVTVSVSWEVSKGGITMLSNIDQPPLFSLATEHHAIANRQQGYIVLLHPAM